MPDDGFGDYVPTPARLRAMHVGYRCLVCHYEAVSSDLDPLLGLLCPQCFRRVLARASVPFLQPVTWAAPLRPHDVDSEEFRKPLEKLDNQGTTRIYRKPPHG